MQRSANLRATCANAVASSAIFGIAPARTDAGEGGDRHPEPGRVDAEPVAGDHSSAFEPADPFGHSGGRYPARRASPDIVIPGSACNSASSRTLTESSCPFEPL